MIHPILKDFDENVDVVPYTRKDRVVSYIILTFVILNCIGVVVGIVWGI